MTAETALGVSSPKRSPCKRARVEKLCDDGADEEYLQYQRSGVRWLLELYKEALGGILGDEMGLGKTVQIIGFLVAVSLSRFCGLGPVLILCPATLLFHWVGEFHKWWPKFRVAVLHDSGSFQGPREELIRKIVANCGVLITSYGMLLRVTDKLLKYNWHIVVLDEGHLIRNPDAKWTLLVKKLRTPYRYIVSGSPMQNSLRELWSLMDFVYPGLLGDLTTFLRELGVPITQGGYANATSLQVKTAYRCAQLLRTKISPCLLRRLKNEVNGDVNLPLKSDHVLFCQLTEEQKAIYREYVQSDECLRILDGQIQIFVGLTYLRKLCNHPDLVKSKSYGFWRRSGKMVVLESMLKLWKSQSHRVALFSQSRQVGFYKVYFLEEQAYTYSRLDGATAVGQRQDIVRTFNADRSIFIMLSTTRVGGLGLDMTGADRVILFDPDWNPTTDVQAQERAWRIGQTRDVLVFRLITSSTVEEKIYHRQIFKQFLINRVLKNPRQKKFLKGLNVDDLFSFIDTRCNETQALFRDADSVKTDVLKRMMNSNGKTPMTVKLSDKKIRRLKEMAKRLSKSMTNNKNNNSIISSSSNSNAKKMVDGVRIPFLDKQTLVDKEADDQTCSSKQNDTSGDYILQSLLRTTSRSYICLKIYGYEISAIDSALSHDQIIDGAVDEDDPMDMEANRIAKQAIKNLKKSQRLMRRRFDCTLKNVPVCPAPTLTSSKEGDLFASNPFCHKGEDHSEKERLSGSDILQLIRKRKMLTETTKSSSSDDDDEPNEQNSSAVIRPLDRAPNDFQLIPCRYAYLVDQLRLFLERSGGEATTDSIIARFESQIPQGDTAVFRSMLLNICTFRRDSTGNGFWLLKSHLSDK
ncbi:DNA excision repair protein ERCC 6 [Trichuris trichiura]|uniref:DNA repair and recombination protein RAD54-like n=1 Tax=Trichuris trichiura TaxID=36087 RepID=A0A077Z2S8_TRITR|nr:DNA excision repair protein ERCC 6 [Trichuris trichiura]